MRIAYEQRAAYFESVAKFAWTRAGENPEATIRLLSPLQPEARARLAEFLIEKNAAAFAPALTCGDAAALTASDREQIGGRLFAKGEFHFAFQVYNNDCEPARTRLKIEDAGFEAADIRTGLGFGWRSAPLPDTVRLFIDEGAAATGKQSLSVVFDGAYNSSLPILSQTICVDKRRRYRLQVAVKTEKIVTGGAPVLQIVLKGKDFKTEVKTIKLPVRAGDDKWNQMSTEFETGEQTEAVEIRFARESCPQSPCPVFGRLWIDDIRLTAAN